MAQNRVIHPNGRQQENGTAEMLDLPFSAVRFAIVPPEPVPTLKEGLRQVRMSLTGFG